MTPKPTNSASPWRKGPNCSGPNAKKYWKRYVARGAKAGPA